MARLGYFRIDQIGTKRATFDSDIEFERDKPYGTSYHRAPVVFDEDEMTVTLAGDGDIPDGSLERIEPDGAAVVNFTGAVPFSNAGTDPVSYGAGWVADGAGHLRAADTGGSPEEVGSTRKVVSIVGDTAWVLFN